MGHSTCACGHGIETPADALRHALMVAAMHKSIEVFADGPERLAAALPEGWRLTNEPPCGCSTTHSASSAIVIEAEDMTA